MSEQSFLTLRALIKELYKYHVDREPDEEETLDMLEPFLQQYGSKFALRAETQLFHHEMTLGPIAYKILIEEEGGEMEDSKVVYKDWDSDDENEPQVVADYELHIFNDYIYQKV